MLVANILEYEEGFRRRPYICSEGYVTIGFGTKVHKSKGLDPEDFLISVNRSTAMGWLEAQLSLIEVRMARSQIYGIYEILDSYPNRRAIVLSMAYQIGVSGLRGFHRFWAAVAMENWEDAAKEMLDSRWAKQTPERARRHAEVMRSGTMSQVYPRMKL